MTAEVVTERKRRYPIIGIVGSLASGKSTLGEVIVRGWGGNGFGTEHVEERFVENPYLDRFYNNPTGGLALPSEKFFLIAKIAQLKEMVGNGAFYTKCQVIDPDLEMDRLYAKVFNKMGWLGNAELATYENFFGCLVEINSIPVPDMYITLMAKPETLMKRVLKRGRKYELLILEKYPEFFEHLSQAVSDWYFTVSTTHGAPRVFSIDTDRYDFATDEEGREDVLTEIGHWTRYYLIDQLKEKAFDGSPLILPDEIRVVPNRIVGK